MNESMDKTLEYMNRFAEGWTEIQKDLKPEKEIWSEHTSKRNGYEICRDSHSCWVRGVAYGNQDESKHRDL